MATKIEKTKSKLSLLLEEQQHLENEKFRTSASEKQAAENKATSDFMSLLKTVWSHKGPGLYQDNNNSITWSIPEGMTPDTESVFTSNRKTIRITKSRIELKLEYWGRYGNQTDDVYEMERVVKEAKEVLAGFDTVSITVPVPIAEDACDTMIAWVKNKAKVLLMDVDAQIARLKEERESFLKKAESLPHPMDALALVAQDHKKLNTRKKAVSNA